MIAPPCPARRRWRPPCPVSGGRRVATIIAVIDRVGAMVNTLIRTYMEVQQARERLEAADRRVLAAYKQYQHALKEYGPAPTHGWWRVKLAARPGPPLGSKNTHDRGWRARTTTAYRYLAHDMRRLHACRLSTNMLCYPTLATCNVLVQGIRRVDPNGFYGRAPRTAQGALLAEEQACRRHSCGAHSMTLGTGQDLRQSLGTLTQQADRRESPR
jgi:hypothetical protein